MFDEDGEDEGVGDAVACVLGEPGLGEVDGVVEVVSEVGVDGFGGGGGRERERGPVVEDVSSVLGCTERLVGAPGRGLIQG